MSLDDPVRWPTEIHSNSIDSESHGPIPATPDDCSDVGGMICGDTERSNDGVVGEVRKGIRNMSEADRDPPNQLLKRRRLASDGSGEMSSFLSQWPCGGVESTGESLEVDPFAGGSVFVTETTGARSPINIPPADNVAPVDYLSLCCDHERVFSFISRACIAVAPRKVMWGSRHNTNRIISGQRAFIRSPKGQTCTMSQLTKGIRIRDIPWLQSCEMSARDNIVTGKCIQAKRCLEKGSEVSKGVGEHRWKHTCLFHVVYWFYVDVVMSLLGRYFYITEGEGRGNETLYFTRADWAVIVAAGSNRLKEHFMPVITSR